MSAAEFDPSDARNKMRDEKLLLDLLSWVPGWVVMRQSEVDRLLNEAEALRIERDAARGREARLAEISVPCQEPERSGLIDGSGRCACVPSVEALVDQKDAAVAALRALNDAGTKVWHQASVGSGEVTLEALNALSDALAVARASAAAVEAERHDG